MKQETHNAGIVEGFISLGKKATGYVRIIDLDSGKKSSNKEESIEIDHGFLNTALHGDRVKVALFSKKDGELQKGEVVEIVTRAKAGFSGILEQYNSVYFLAPSDTKMYFDIIIPKEKLNGAEVGKKVFGVITEWPDPKKAPIGEIVKVLGDPRENDAEMHGIALEKGFSPDFPVEVEQEAEAIEKRGITEDDIKDRRDMRQTLTFTIDPDDAKDFDDALSVKELGNGMYEIGIHIADVSHYVRPGTALDEEAYRRATSVYLVDRTIPMLPEALSNNLCSLNEHVDRLTFSAIFDMDIHGTVHKEWYGKTIIYSDKRFTYGNAQEILDKKEGLHYNELHLLNTIAKALHKKRFEKGAISLEQDEIKFKLDEKGVPIGVYRKERGDTNKLIEEFMLLANRKVAEEINEKDKDERVFVYRVHDSPDPDRTADLVKFLGKLGYKVKQKDGRIPSEEINKLLDTLEGKEEKDTIQTAIVRSMAKAVYSTKNIGHYGLAFEFYAHFTSPIRRYPDTIVHRLLFEYLQNKRIEKSHWKEYELAALHSSQQEKNASDAERASIKYKQVEYMTYHIGAIYDGVVTGLTEWGLFVEEKETKCEGMVRMKDMTDDMYIFNEKEFMIEGKKTKKKYKIGDNVKIKVTNADINKKIIDYVFV